VCDYSISTYRALKVVLSIDDTKIDCKTNCKIMLMRTLVQYNTLPHAPEETVQTAADRHDV
jgi:hypothetical protein